MRSWPATSFVLDCSNESINSLDPDCMRLRDLFVGKEVLGSSVTEDCGIPYETENPFKRVKRVIYVHDSRDGLWYHCCECRPPFGYFSHRTPAPKLEAEDVSLGSMAMKFASGLFSKKKSSMSSEQLPVGQAPETEGDFQEQPQGPLLQCNVFENLKLVQNKDHGHRFARESWRYAHEVYGRRGGAAASLHRRLQTQGAPEPLGSNRTSQGHRVCGHWA